MLDDDASIIKAGIKGNVDYLIDLLKQKCTDDAKLIKSSKRNQSSPPLDRTINTSSTTTESTMVVLSSNSSNIVTSKSLNLSLYEHKTCINNTLNNWCRNNESRLNLSNFGVLKTNIKCCCNKWISLTNNRGKFQLSNCYRHLQDFRNNDTCDKMKELIKDCKRISSITADNQQSFTCSNTTPDHESSPNAILLNSTSTSIATDDHESLEQPSPLLKSKSRAKRKLQSVQSSYNAKEVVKRTRRQ
ncbi:unnamed protein product [Rotaria magnacalcarata]|uniref:Uncharacterized protein n=1 Tax=Rotaria magnacalcarata TaxID=392030 RepID=A0A816U6S5_9BILA|nr:unnamed protein product [Rotaria magnacalcarata]